MISDVLHISDYSMISDDCQDGRDGADADLGDVAAAGLDGTNADLG